MSCAAPAPVYRLRLSASGQTVQAPADQTLLQALLAAGIAWPASCRNGTCRQCRGHLVEGTVHYRVAWPGLLPEEKVSGAVLPCVAQPCSDLRLAPAAD